MRTWQLEATAMGTLLSVSTSLAIHAGAGWSQVICGCAVFVTFLHAQVSDRLREYAAGGDIPPECAKLERVYYVMKEVLWLGFFAITLNFPALMGTVGFLLYPRWRAWWRSRT